MSGLGRTCLMCLCTLLRSVMAIANLVKILGGGGGGGGAVSNGNINLVQVVGGGGGGVAIAPLANPLTVALVVCMTDDGG